MKTTIFLILAFTISVQAQLPDAPKPRIARDEKILILSDFLAANADAASSVAFNVGHEPHGAGCAYEVNSWLYGLHPNPTRYFVQMNAQAAGLNLGAHLLRKLAARSKQSFWLRAAQFLPLWDTGAHTVAIAQTARNCS